MNTSSSLSEFSMIETFFKRSITDPHVLCGVGDDAALLSVPQNVTLAVTTDSLVEGIHFPKNTTWFDRGFKTAAVNLSDLAAMGANPQWVSLSLCLPDVDNDLLAAFSEGFFKVLSEFHVSLIGGDVCRSPVWMATVTAQGFLPHGKVLHRSGAQVGDDIYVTNTVGDAGLALTYVLDNKIMPATLHERFYRPRPDIEAGILLRDMAHAAIDVSDGLSADLQHILDQSDVGARLQLEALPLSLCLQALPKETAWHFALNGGDDYVLCFTAAKKNQRKILDSLPTARCIGVIEKEKGLRWYEGEVLQTIASGGFKHFE